jgi:hypothetical protein
MARRTVERYGGRVIAFGLVEWKSRSHFDDYRDDPEPADLHPHREAGGGAYVWHPFDRLDDLRPLLRGDGA